MNIKRKENKINISNILDVSVVVCTKNAANTIIECFKSIKKIKLGLDNELRLGNLDAKRDWGFTGDYVKAMWLMLQQDLPEDYVIATGITHSVKDLVQIAFDYVNLNWEDYVVVDLKFVRPAEVDLLLGDSTKARKKLGWKPEVDLKSLIKMMVDYDLEKIKNDINLSNIQIKKDVK